MEVELEYENAPIAVNNFVYLARYKFYDGLSFHKAIPGFIIQGGDPLGNSRGGPGYEFVDELPKENGYPVGVLAMAGGGKENPNSNGSHGITVSIPTSICKALCW